VELVRQKEKIWIENFKNIKMTDEAIIETLTTYPILIERPILVKGDKAIIGRDLDKVFLYNYSTLYLTFFCDLSIKPFLNFVV
jgi:arsenate reductase